MGIRKYSKTFKNVQKLSGNIRKLRRNIRKLSENIQKYRPLCVKQAEGKIPRNKYQISNNIKIPSSNVPNEV